MLMFLEKKQQNKLCSYEWKKPICLWSCEKVNHEADRNNPADGTE